MRKLFSVVFLGSVISIVGQTSSPSVTPGPGPSSNGAAAASAAPSLSDDRNLKEGLGGMSENSKTLTGWALTIFGGSILAIASTSYLRPLSRKVRAIYLLFVPGWLFLGLSVFEGDQLSRSYTATVFAKSHELLLKIGSNINIELAAQMNYFNWGLGFFALWLVVFVLWWIFGDVPPSGR